jgi:cytochrome c-type biogenesis protein CcmH
MIWLILVPMALMAALGVLLPFIRPSTAGDGPSDGPTPLALKARLAEIDRQAADGDLSEPEAAALRLEAQRRILSESRTAETAARPLSPRALTVAGAAFAVFVLVGGGLLYGLLGRPDLASPDAQVAAQPDSSIDRMIAALETQVRETPDDGEMWRILGQAYSQGGRFDDAARAYERGIMLMPQDGRMQSARGEALVQAAGGVVTDDAFAAFQAANALDPAEPRTRYFLALRKDQTGDRDGAMDDWIALLNSAPPGAPWVPQVRALVDQVAAERGIDVSERITGSAAAGSPGF